jgi:hypothetical protein
MSAQDSAMPASSSSLPTFTADVDTMSRKRPHHEVASPTFAFTANKSMRPSPAATPPRLTTRPVSPGSDSSLEIIEQAFAQQNGGWQFRNGSSDPRVAAMMNKQREAETQARHRDAQRREQLDRDRRLAASLSSNTSYSRTPSGSSQQAVFNRDGTIRRPNPQSHFKTEQNSSFSNPYVKTEPSMNGSSSFSMQPNQYGIKKEALAFKTEQPQGSSWHPQGNPIWSIESDSEGSDVEVIDAAQFAQSSRSRNASMQNPNTQIYQHHLQPIYNNQGHNQPLSHQQSMINNGTQTPVAGDNGSFNSYPNGMPQQAKPTPANTWDNESRYWTDLLKSTNSFIGGFQENFATLHNMVGLGNPYGSNKLSQPSQSMPGAFPGTFNGYGTVGSSRNVPVIDLDDDDDDEEAPSTAFNYLYNDSSKTADEVKALIENIAAGGEVPPEMRGNAPEAMAGPLFEHQKIGLKWLKEKYVTS